MISLIFWRNQGMPEQDRNGLDSSSPPLTLGAPHHSTNQPSAPSAAVRNEKVAENSRPPSTSWHTLIKPAGIDDLPMLLADPLQVSFNYKAFVTKSLSGDSLAAIALYQHAKYCMQRIKDTGGNYPEECAVGQTQAERDPFYWLLLPSNAGSPKVAATLYSATNGLLQYGPSSPRNDQLKLATLDALEKSLPSGSSEIIFLLSAAFHDGILAQPDYVKSYAYIDIYAKATGDQGAINRAKKLYTNLRESDREGAARLQKEIELLIARNRRQ